MLASGGDDILDDPNGLGPIKLFDVGAWTDRKLGGSTGVVPRRVGENGWGDDA